MTPLGEVKKFSHWVRFTDEEYTDALHEACAYMGIDSTGLSDEEMQARIDEHMAGIYAAVGRRFDEVFGRTPDQLPGHPLVQPKETP